MFIKSFARQVLDVFWLFIGIFIAASHSLWRSTIEIFRVEATGLIPRIIDIRFD